MGELRPQLAAANSRSFMGAAASWQVLSLLFFFLVKVNSLTTQVSLVSFDVISVTEATYASWNIDSSCNRGFHHINFTNPNLLAAARGLRPSRLRFGGSGNDNLVYGFTKGSPECNGIDSLSCVSPGYTNPGCLNGSHWQALHDLGHNSETDFIFGLAYGLVQACQEGPSYTWNYTNAVTLLDHVREMNQTIWGFELGNEVNNNGPNTACNQLPEQQAHALLRLTEILQSKLPGKMLIGPDTGGRDPLPWLSAYLPLVSKPGLLHAVTHHVYAGLTRGNYNSSALLNKSLPEIAWYNDVIAKHVPHAQVWSGENGPIGGGADGSCGANSACGTYSTTLWFADDLAQRAKFGFVQYQRQDLFGGHYGLTNSPSSAQALGPSEPLMLRPDYWLSFIYKRTLGTKVHNVTSSNRDVRAYGFSGVPPSPFYAAECGGAGVELQLLLVNLKDETAHVQLSTPSTTSGSTNGYLSYSAWTLAPPLQGPFSKSAVLNLQPLPDKVDVNEADPTFLKDIPVSPIRKTSKDGISLAPLSTTFVCTHS